MQYFIPTTQAWSDTQAKWLDQELTRSTARWKVVYGHHGFYPYGTHGDTADLKQSLLPILRNRVQHRNPVNTPFSNSFLQGSKRGMGELFQPAGLDQDYYIPTIVAPPRY